jgi:hypothetical protein
MNSIINYYQGDKIVVSNIIISCNWSIKIIKDGLLSWEGEISGVIIDSCDNIEVIFGSFKRNTEIKGNVCISSYEVGESLISCYFEGSDKPEIKD